MPTKSKAKKLDTLVEDIYGVFENYVEPSQKDLNTFAKNLAETIRSRIVERREGKQSLRLSQIGTPIRKLWYSIKDTNQPTLSGKDRLKFLYGDILEELLLLLIKTAGHKIEDEQKEVQIDGVVGHQDCRIDGIVTDIKSASSFAFKKFKDGSLINGNDPFGYIPQISAYAEAQGENSAAFLVINKENADLHVLDVDFFDMIHVPDRIKTIKEVIQNDKPPEKCFEDEAEGVSGNRVLSINCSWCPYKFPCWSDSNNGHGLRIFDYAKGKKYFTKVVKEPNVKELSCQSLIIDKKILCFQMKI